MWWQDRVDQRVAEVEYAKQACAAAGLDYAEVFGGGAKAPAGAPVETIPPEDDPMEEQEIIQTD
jgi:hypothetical protein